MEQEKILASSLGLVYRFGGLRLQTPGASMILYTSTQSYLSHLPVVGLSMDSCRAGAGSAERLVAWPTVAGKEDETRGLITTPCQMTTNKRTR
jgi:hypothetical protein